MKLVKVERDGANAQGILEGDAVRIVGGWREGPADAAPFTLSRLSPEELRGHSCEETCLIFFSVKPNPNSFRL